jgi:hypothetical protein
MKMKLKFLYLFLISLLITSCHLVYQYSVKITNLDSEEKILKLAFKFDKQKIQNIKIVNESDSVIVEAYSNEPLKDFLYPNSFDSINLIYPSSKDKLPLLEKDKVYHFKFGGTSDWKYEPFYATKEGRWLFDEKGNQKGFNAKYERWVGKDIILVQTPNEIKFEKSTFLIKDENGNPINHEIKSETNPSKKFALVLNKDEPTEKLLTILINSENGLFSDGDKKYNKYVIKVPNKSTVGIAGKYNSL